jgi:hypothetical protein
MKSHLLFIVSMVSTLAVAARASEQKENLPPPPSGLHVVTDAPANGPSLIPMPEQMTVKNGTFSLDASTRIMTDERINNVGIATGQLLAQRLRAATGLPLSFKHVIGFSSKAVPS